MKLKIFETVANRQVAINPDHVTCVVPDGEKSVKVYLSSGEEDYFIVNVPFHQVVNQLSMP